MLPQGLDSDIGQGDVAATGIGLGRLENDALAFVSSSASRTFDYTAVEIEPPSREGQHLAQPHPGEEGQDGHRSRGGRRVTCQ